jgi:catechol-2,3-dioxygenase
MGNIGEIQEEIERWVSPSPSPGRTSMPLSLNHVSFVCKSVPESVKFYEDVLGFVLIKRPSSFKFEGAWYVYIYAYTFKFNADFLYITSLRYS